MAYTYPGVFVTETPLKSRPQARSAAATPAAFLGTSARGNSSKAIAISSWNQYKLEFGDLDPAYDLGYSVYQYFANGGRDAYVVRVFGAGSTAASASITYQKTPSTGASSSGNLYTVTARSVGAWANYTTASTSVGIGGLTITVTAGTVTNSITGVATNVGTFNLSVALAGTEVEYWPDLSPNPAANRYAPTIINNYSTYITLSNSVDVTPFLGSIAYASGATFSNGVTATVASDAWVTGLSKLDVIPEGLLINAVGQYDSITVGNVMTKAQSRGTSFAIIDPDPTQATTGGILAVVSGYTPKNYGAVYYPMLTMTDPTKSGIGAIRTTFPGGAVAGAYVRTELERSVAKPPAGYSTDVRNCFAPVISFSDADIGTLYNSGVNTFKSVPGTGVCIMGARTLETTRPDKYVNLRRSLNYVKERSFFLTQFAVFEPNDEFLWSTTKVRLAKFLTDFWQIGGLKGASPAEAFYIICDSSNNTPSAIENGELRIEIGVALQYPAEFVIINISQIAGSSAAI